MATNSPSAQMATATESEETVRRIATGPNGCTQAATNRTKPSHTGIRASLAGKFCGAAGCPIQALFWLEWGSSNFTRAPPPAPAPSQTHGNPGPGAVNDAGCPILARSLRKGGIPRHVPFEILFHRASVL